MNVKIHTLKDGAVLTSHDDHIGNVLRDSKTYYERDMLKYIKENIPHGGVYIDVGANIGNHSVFFAKYCGAEVHAFEPVQYNYNLLHINFKNNKVPGCIYKYALSDTLGECRMKVSPENMGMCEVSAYGELVAKMYTLDSLIANTEVMLTSKPVNLVKIDVEGHEPNVLRGAASLIDQYKPEIFVEAATDATYNEVNALLTTLGYVVVQKFNHTPTYHFQHKSKRVSAGA